MTIVRNLLAIIGLVALVAVVILYAKLSGVARDFDPGAFDMYREFVAKLLETQDPADAMVWAVPVEEDIDVEDVKESLKSLAVARNLFFVSESPFYKQAEAVSGAPYRHVTFMLFCDVRVGMKMADYNNAYTALMPCNISVVEDAKGRLWLYALNMDFLIYGGKELPPDLKKDAIKVSRNIRELMQGAAAGEF